MGREPSEGMSCIGDLFLPQSGQSQVRGTVGLQSTIGAGLPVLEPVFPDCKSA